MELNMMYSILGVCGGLLTVIADMLFDIKGKDNKELGDQKFINSNWECMSEIRFKVSVLLVTVGVPLCCLGVISLVNQIEIYSNVMANLLLISYITGAIGGYFIHMFVCICPVIYKELIKTTNFEIAEKVILKVWNTINIPFILLYVVLVIVTSILVIISIVQGYLNVPLWCVLLNPMCFQLIGLALKKIFPTYCYEIPSIFMGSLGIAMYGIIGLLNILG